jgi:peptide/nickel transport system permease protein
MAVYVVKRLLWAVLLFFVMTMVTYIVFFVIPYNYGAPPGRTITAQDLRQSINIHGGFLQQYWQFVSGLFGSGSLGESYFTGRSVKSMLTSGAPVTFALVLGGVFIAVTVALFVGLVSALRPRSLVDRAGMVFVLFGISAHPVWLGFSLSYLFAFQLGWFPVGGYCDMFGAATRCGGPGQWAYHMALPWITFAMLFGAFYARLIRAGVMETMNEDFVRTARAKGLPEFSVIRSHVLRIALAPIVALLALDIGGLALGVIGSSLFVETAFGLPGVGRTAAVALQRGDLPVIVGVVVFVTLCVVIANLIADVLYVVLDPRVKLSGKPL